jgi:hypothetical protein
MRDNVAQNKFVKLYIVKETASQGGGCDDAIKQ